VFGHGLAIGRENAAGVALHAMCAHQKPSLQCGLTRRWRREASAHPSMTRSGVGHCTRVRCRTPARPWGLVSPLPQLHKKHNCKAVMSTGPRWRHSVRVACRCHLHYHSPVADATCGRTVCYGAWEEQEIVADSTVEDILTQIA